MIVKTLQLDIFLPQSNSLKDKRSTLNSLKQRCRQKFNVTIAEVGDTENVRNARIGIVTVTNSDAYADQTLDKCLYLIETQYPIDIINVERDRD